MQSETITHDQILIYFFIIVYIIITTYHIIYIYIFNNSDISGFILFIVTIVIYKLHK